MSKQLQVVIAGAISVMAAGAIFAGGLQNQPEPKCKISPVEAIRIALQKVPGKPIQANFEFDEGHWIYGVMIVHGKVIQEVEIDPLSGKIGAVETVTPDAEAKEIKASLTKAIGGKVSSAKEKETDEKGEKSEKTAKPAKRK